MLFTDTPLPSGNYSEMSQEDRLRFAVSAKRIIMLMHNIMTDLSEAGDSDVEKELFFRAGPAAMIAVLKVWGRSPINLKAELEIDPDAFIAEGKRAAAVFLRNVQQMNNRVAARDDSRAMPPELIEERTRLAIENFDAPELQKMIHSVVKSFVEQLVQLYHA